MITIAIAEDHKALIDGIESFIRYEEDITLVGKAMNGKELLKIVKNKQPNIVLCDIRMPVLDGIDVTKTIKSQFKFVKVIAFTMFDQEEAIRKMLDAGADGYILKNSGLDTVLEGIRSVASGNQYFDKKLNISTQPGNYSKSVLSSREIEVLNLIAKGKTSHQIADVLFIGKSTVDTHRKNIIRKLKLSGHGELLRYAVEKKYDFEK